MNRNGYITHPDFSVPCGGGTLFVFKHMDDLHFCHEACFEEEGASGGPTRHRFAYVFRWLELKHSFYTDRAKNHCMKLNAAQCVRAHERQVQRKRKQARSQSH